MKLDKTLAIARRNKELGGAVLGVNNAYFAVLNRNKNIWWFDVPIARLQIGQYEWVHLLAHHPLTDALQHLRVPTRFLRENLDNFEQRNVGKRKASVSLELSADQDSWLNDVRPKGKNLKFAPFLEA